MARIIESRVRETSTTTGTGDFTVAGAVSGRRTFSAVCSVGDTFEYVIDGGTEWEYGIGIYSAADTVKRLLSIRSTNSNAKVNFSAGTKNVWIDGGLHTLKFKPENGFFAHYGGPNAYTSSNNNGYHVSTSGGSLAASPAAIAGIIGGLTIGLGTTTTARAALVGQNASGVNNFVALGSGVAHFKGRLDLNVLSTGTDTYSARIGMHGGTSGEATAGVFFRYTDSVNSGKWQAVTKQNSTETATDTGVTAQITTASTFEIYVDAAAANAYFFIDGVLVATNTTNIPTGVGSNQPVGYGTMFLRSAGTASLADTASLYFQQFEYFYTTPF